MNDKITVLNFDQIYYRQPFLENYFCEWIDLESIPHTNLFCDKDALLHVNSRLKQRKSGKITLLGSGNYHYVSSLLLSHIEKPFTLILFDHHTDAFKSPSETVISCGSWVFEALDQLPMLKKVIMFGVNENWQNQIPLKYNEKITAYSEKDLHENFLSIMGSLRAQIPTESVYLSIDKDVLNTGEAITAWDHGTMTLAELTKIVEDIIQNKEVSGVDICGEYPINPSNEFKKETREAIKKNQYANQYILDSLVG